MFLLALQRLRCYSFVFLSVGRRGLTRFAARFLPQALFMLFSFSEKLEILLCLNTNFVYLWA